MGLFNRKRVDTVDFTKMPDAKIPQPAKNMKYDGDAVDLRDQNIPTTSDSSTESTANVGSMDFLSTMASSSNAESSPRTNVMTEVSEISELKQNMRKLSSQVDDSSNEVYRLLQRIELLEKKIERFENRGV